MYRHSILTGAFIYGGIATSQTDFPVKGLSLGLPTMNIGATALWDPWDASPPTLEIMGNLVPSNFCN